MINQFRGSNFYLSNFYSCDITVGPITFPSTEHAFQATKATNESDLNYVRWAASPKEAKKRGQKIELRNNWDSIRYNIMTTVTWLKFSQNHDLQKRLMKTGQQELIEGNRWHDNYWGQCFCDKCKSADAYNYLGCILMTVRTSLQVIVTTDPIQFESYTF